MKEQSWIMGLGAALLVALWVMLAATSSGPSSGQQSEAAAASNSMALRLAAAQSPIRVDALAPNFKLKKPDGTEVELASFRGQRPVALLFGSYSCEQLRYQRDLLTKVSDAFLGKAEFFLVYIREAHPQEGWVIPENEHEGIAVAESKTYAERQSMATTACSKLKLPFPSLVDGLDDAVSRSYLAWPARFVLVDTEGKIVVVSDRNPLTLMTAILQAREWLKKHTT